MEYVKGTITAVSKYGGIMLKGAKTWYNPSTTSKKQEFIDNKGILLKKEVILSMLPNKPNVFSHISIREAEPQGINTAKESDKDSVIIREVAIKAAASFHANRMGDADMVIATAKKFEAYLKG